MIKGSRHGFSPLGLAVIAGCQIIGLALGGLAVLPKLAQNTPNPKYTLDGKALSEAEVNAGLDEVTAMMQGAKAGDSSSADTDFRPQTALGKRFHGWLVNAKEIQSRYEQTLAEHDIGRALGADRLSTPSGCDQSLDDIDNLQSIEADFEQKQEGLSEDLVSIMAASGAKSAPSLIAKINTENHEVLAKEDESFEAYRRVVQFAKEAHPAKRNGQLLFSASSYEEYKRLADAADKSQSAFIQLQQSMLAQRQAVMSESLSKLAGRG